METEFTSEEVKAAIKKLQKKKKNADSNKLQQKCWRRPC